MAYKYREEIVGKRFLSVCNSSKLKFTKISDWAWRSGIVRAASHKDPKHPELTVLVEFDDTDWKSREWLRLYQDSAFVLFLVENTLVWTLRKETVLTRAAVESLYWPSLTFTSLVDKAGLADSRLQPVEYLVDKELEFVDYAAVLQYEAPQDEDVECIPASTDFAEIQKAIKQWTEYQDGQRILVTTPSVLVGYRVEVYRVEGTTQWYTAVIVSYNDNTRELTLTDDTVLEEHSEDPCLVQMKLIGDGVVDSILKGENVGITPRRRACTNQQNNNNNIPIYPAHYSTRTRSHHSVPSCFLSRLSLPPVTRRSKTKPTATATSSDDLDGPSTSYQSCSSTADKPHSLVSRQQSHHSTDKRKKSSDLAVASTSNYRKCSNSSDGKKRNWRINRPSTSKGIYEDSDSTEDDECYSRQSKTSETSKVVNKQHANNTRQTRAASNGCSESVLCPNDNAAEKSHAQPSVKSAKSSCAKSGVKTRDVSEKKISHPRISSPLEVQHTNNLPPDKNPQDNQEASTSKANNSGSFLSTQPPVSAAVSGVSVVLTPLSPSFVSAAVNCATSLAIDTTKADSISEAKKLNEESVSNAPPAKERVVQATQRADVNDVEKEQLKPVNSNGGSSKSASTEVLNSVSDSLKRSEGESNTIFENAASSVTTTKKLNIQDIDVSSLNQASSVVCSSPGKKPVCSKSHSPRIKPEYFDFDHSLIKYEYERARCATTKGEYATIRPSSVKREKISERSETVKRERAGVSSETVKRERAGVCSETAKRERASVSSETAKRERAGVSSETAKQEKAGVSSESAKQEKAGVSSESAKQEKAAVCSDSVKPEQTSVHSDSVKQELASIHSEAVKQGLPSIHSEAVKQGLPSIHSEAVKQGLPSIRSGGVKQELTRSDTQRQELKNFRFSSVKQELKNFRLESVKQELATISSKNVRQEIVSARGESVKSEVGVRSVSVQQEANVRPDAIKQERRSLFSERGRPEIKIRTAVNVQQDQESVIRSESVKKEHVRARSASLKYEHSALRFENVKQESYPSCSSSIRHDYTNLQSSDVKQEYSSGVEKKSSSCDVKSLRNIRIKTEYSSEFNSRPRTATVISPPRDIPSVLKYQPHYGGINYSEPNLSNRNIIVSTGHQRQSSCKTSVLSVGHSYTDAKNSISRSESYTHNVAAYPGNANLLQNTFASSGMPHVDRVERRALEKTSNSFHHIVAGPSGSRNYQPSTAEFRTGSPRPTDLSIKERSRSEERRNVSSYHVDRHESVNVYRDHPLLVSGNSSVRHVDCLHNSLMHPAGISHTAAAAAAVYPRVPTLPQHNRNPGAPIPPNPLGPYSLTSHLLPPSHVAGASAAAASAQQQPPPPPPPGSHIDQQHAAAMQSQAQAYRQLLPQHPLIPPQYSSAAAPHVGIDMMWQQKYSPNPWVMAHQYEEIRLERDRVIVPERSRIERDRHSDIERLDREKTERDKLEKERHEQERERLLKEQQRHDRERLDREERERAQREAVQQHFEESLRLALQKQQQLQQKTMGWSPMSSLPLGKMQPGIGRSSPTVSLPQGAHSQSLHSSDHERDKVRDKEKERISAMEARMRHEHERWLAAVQQRSEQVVAHASPHHHGYPPVEGRVGNVQAKELYPMPRSSPHSSSNAGLPSHPSHKSGIIPSPGASPHASNVPSPQQKPETSFSLYGYQPFQHTYISHAQLKAREESKSSCNMQPMILSGCKQSNTGQIKQEKEMLYERSPTPGNSRTNTPVGQSSSGKQQLKLLHQGQERASPMYQPLGSGGAFKPYEYSNTSPAPPAHQSSSPITANRLGASHFHLSQQEQPQNLVKADHKMSHDQSVPLHSHQRYETRDIRQAVSTPPCTIPSSYTPPYSLSKSASPAANSNYSYNLIQQGLVPNPLYIASSHNGSSSAINALPQTPSKISPHAGSPPVPQQYTRPNISSGITSGTLVCRSSSAPHASLQGRSGHSYSPVGHFSGQAVAAYPNRTGPQEAHSASRVHYQGASHRSPSPAHLYSAQPLSIQCGRSNSPHHSRVPTMCSSPRISTTPNPPPMHVTHRVPVHTVMNTHPLSPPQSTSSDSQALPLNLQGSSSIGKRKSPKDVSGKKRQKLGEEHLMPPQLHPQIRPTSCSPVRQIGTPPHLLSNNSFAAAGLHVNMGGNALSVPTPSPVSPSTQILNRPESSVTPLSMPELLCNPNAACVTTANVESHGCDVYHPFMTATNDVQAATGKYAKAQGKTSADSSNLDIVDLPGRPASNASSASNIQSTPVGIVGSHDGTDDNRMAVSPASSASSTITSCSSTGGGTNHTKLKKAWLQRHSENEDKKIPGDVAKIDCNVKLEAAEEVRNLPSKITLIKPTSALVDSQDAKHTVIDGNIVDVLESKVLKTDLSAEDDSTSSASEMEEEVKHVKRKLRIIRKQGTSTPNSKRQKTPLTSAEIIIEDYGQFKREKDNGKKKNIPGEKDNAANFKRRGRKTKGRSVPTDDCQKKKSPKPPEKPSVAQLKKTGEAFLQDGPCCEVAPRLPKCRECRMTPHQRSKKMPNIFCRFYAYRKLRYGKNGTILGAGFSEPSDATQDDLKLWLPPIDSPPSDIEVETSKFLLTHVGDQFCDLVEMEREAQTMHMSEDSTITWKRVVQGVREMCDVCETTLFNIHWVCHKCGFVVCIDCYKARKGGFGKGEESPTKDRDEFQWLLCSNRQPHEQEKLMLTQIIASTALWDVGKTLHDVRRKWNIPTYCNCSIRDGEQDGKHSTNGICKLMSAVTKCFSSDKETSQVNGLSESSRSSRKTSKSSSVNGVVKQDDPISGYSSESGGSPLSWLADVALNSSGKVKDEKKKKSKVEDGEDEKLSDSQYSQVEGFAESDDERNENFSTLRELLIRPMGKMGSKNSGTDSGSQKTLTSTLDEVISCVIEQRVRKSDKKCKEKQLLHFTRRHQMLHSGRELLPIRSCMLTESSLLYPETPHHWLGSGKILVLTDSHHYGNMQMFQEQWKRGQPVIVASVGQKLDNSLWTPESFTRDFGDMKNDFFNCAGGTLVQNLPMKKFWEGFENTSKRMRDDSGQHMILKLKDWPPSEEFSELLPSRYQDLIKVLPLPQYTHRDGTFNMASRLPDCFVRPDLGPRMYSAYGLTASCGKGSTNLHLDVSDAVNVLAYIGKLDDGDISDEDIFKALDESGCDSLMTKHCQESGFQVGAIWHVYNARDADKIRDLLNKVAVEQGAKSDPHHDPIHNQEWYLDEPLRDRLYKEYGVEGYVIAQCLGDALFIPAGSPHQVKNLKSCVKVSEDFVSPESVGHSFFLTQEIRNLIEGPSNPEDRLQIKNIIYHAVKDALALLQSCDPEDSKS